MKKVSFLIPTYNEIENVEELSRAIINEIEKLPRWNKGKIT